MLRSQFKSMQGYAWLNKVTSNLNYKIANAKNFIRQYNDLIQSKSIINIKELDISDILSLLDSNTAILRIKANHEMMDNSNLTMNKALRNFSELNALLFYTLKFLFDNKNILFKFCLYINNFSIEALKDIDNIKYNLYKDFIKDFIVDIKMDIGNIDIKILEGIYFLFFINSNSIIQYKMANNFISTAKFLLSKYMINTIDNGIGGNIYKIIKGIDENIEKYILYHINFAISLLRKNNFLYIQNLLIETISTIGKNGAYIKANSFGNYLRKITFTLSSDIINKLFLDCLNLEEALMKQKSEILPTDKLIDIKTKFEFPPLMDEFNLKERVYKHFNKIFWGFEIYEYLLDKKSINILTEGLLLQAIRDFWRTIVTNNLLNNPSYRIAVQIRFMTTNGEWRNLGKYTSYQIGDMHNFLIFISSLLQGLASHYIASQITVSRITFSWKILTENDSIIQLKTRQNFELANPLSNFAKGLENIPMVWRLKDMLKDGIIMQQSRYNDMEQFIKNIPLIGALGHKLLTTWKVLWITDTIRMIWILDPTSNNIITEFKDIMLLDQCNEEEIVFKRIFPSGNEIIIRENIIEQICAKTDKYGAYMQSLSKAYWNENSIIENTKVDSYIQDTRLGTFDIETRETHDYHINKLGEHILKFDAFGNPIKSLKIISIAWASKDLRELHTDNQFAKMTLKFWVIQDFNSEAAMIRDFFTFIKERAQLSRSTDFLFAHNSARFDLIFLLRHLINIDPNPDTNLNFLVRDGKFISVEWKVPFMKMDKNTMTLTPVLDKNKNPLMKSIKLLDSYLILPMSLAKAAIQFGVVNKGSFNFEELNKIKDDETLTAKQIAYKLNEFREILREYNTLDCMVLWNVLGKYAQQVAENYNINIFKHPTVASIAFATFRTNYLDSQKALIPISSNHIYKEISAAYLGGAVDVYKPTNPPGTKVYTYDINSEYPAMMAQNLMPTGPHKHIIGHINVNDPNLIAFVKAKITCPDNILIPILGRKVNGKMICGAGTWTGMYFSAELREAISRGYIIEPYEAYIYEGRNIFKDFIEDLYKTRLSYPKSDPMNLICKLIMNSTYGRFGMAPELTNVSILSKSGLNSFTDQTIFNDIQEINENYVMVNTSEQVNKELDSENPNRNLQISIPIAAAITSYSRICIHRYKWAAAEQGSLLYSDTDSLITSQPLPTELIGSGLGQLKLENISDKGIFLSPKVYALHNESDPSKDILKAKGLKSNIITFKDYETLLNKSQVFRTTQEKWFRDITEGTIKLINMTTMVRINEGKRVIITDLEDNFIDTGNIIFRDGEIISPNIIKLGVPALIEQKLIEAPKTRLIEAPKTQLIEAPNTLLIEGPKSLLITAPHISNDSNDSNLEIDRNNNLLEVNNNLLEMSQKELKALNKEVKEFYPDKLSNLESILNTDNLTDGDINHLIQKWTRAKKYNNLIKLLRLELLEREKQMESDIYPRWKPDKDLPFIKNKSDLSEEIYQTYLDALTGIREPNNIDINNQDKNIQFVSIRSDDEEE